MKGDVFVGQIVPIIMAIRDQDNNILNISGATTQQMKIQKPDGTVSTHTTQFVVDGADGQIQYVTQTGDLDIPGDYQFEGFVTLNGILYPADIITQTVKQTL